MNAAMRALAPRIAAIAPTAHRRLGRAGPTAVEPAPGRSVVARAPPRRSAVEPAPGRRSPVEPAPRPRRSVVAPATLRPPAAARRPSVVAPATLRPSLASPAAPAPAADAAMRARTVAASGGRAAGALA